MRGLLVPAACRWALALVAGGNLLLVCQGHLDAHHQTGPHLAFMDEIDAGGAVQNTAQAPGGGVVQASILHAGAEDPMSEAGLATIAIGLESVPVSRLTAPITRLRTSQMLGVSRLRASPPDPPPQPSA